MRVNADLLRQRAKEIRDALEILGRYGSLPLEQFLAGAETVDAAKYRLLVAIEAAVSICNHLASRLANRTPESYADCFAVLGTTGIISKDLADRLGQMARFRNLLVHLYWQVSDAKVWEVLRQNLGDLEAYLSAVGEFGTRAWGMNGRRLPDRDKAEIKGLLRRLLAQREEIRFACLHGSFLEPHGFRDVDLAVWVDPDSVRQEAAMDYEFKLSAWIEQGVPHPIDVKVLNYAPLSFQYAVTKGEPVCLRDEEEWFAFREQTWRDYLDFAPLAKEALLDLLGPAC